MHVLILPSWYIGTYNPLNGSFIREQAHSLSEQGIKVGIIYNNLVYTDDILRSKKLFKFQTVFFRDQEIPTYLAETYQLPNIPGLNFPSKVLRFINQFRNKRKWLKLFKIYVKHHGIPDLLHVHSFYPDEVPRIISKKYNIKFLITEHWSGFNSENEFNKRKTMILRCYSGASKIIAVSSFLGNIISKKLGQECTVIPNGIDSSAFNISKRKREEFTFVSVGHLRPIKKYDILIRAFKGIPNAALTIVGDGVSMNELKSLAEKEKVNVNFTGRLSRQKVLEEISSSHVLVSSSQTETFGMTLIEALSCGIPVVSTNSGGPADIINSSDLGILCEQNEESLRSAMLRSKDIYKSYNQKLIRENAINRFSEINISKKLINIYKTLI